MSQLIDVFELVEEWADRTDRILKEQMKRLKVGEKGGGDKELFFSLRSNVYAKYGDKVQMDLSFIEHGRFRDMGAGSGKKAKIETMAGNLALATASARKRKGRKPAKWYSKPFYGRLNALLGVVSGEVQEVIIETLKEVATGPQQAPKTRRK
ncbi:hypothetical protein EFA69_16275 [Rufibacter immobilis]|uniref:Uncharacterized protein n=1 Tax=Rufibacter immobilis TaxID=1348778 RepID=A0A3M9MQ67_9BACT|nr:hypothetical protein [Rufibacter immobilis]RNI27674.1 hypothetical protein EFA69_16275 [Rufibacter immobilis]